MKLTAKILIPFLFLFSIIAGYVGYALNARKLVDEPISGDAAAHFKTELISGNMFDLSKVSDSSTVYLSFLRFSSCPICNYRVHELIDRLGEFEENNIVPLLVFESTREDLTKYADFYDIPIEMIADPENELYDLYQVEENLVKLMINSRSEEIDQQFAAGTELFYDDIDRDSDPNLGRLPADFVIKSGKLVLANYGEHVGDNTPINKIIELAN